MSIPFNRYINITSGRGAGAATPRRDLIGRFITTDSALATGGLQEFTTADDVATFFGAASPEHLRAIFYFGFLSKQNTRPSRISFARWADVDTAASVLGARIPSTLAQLQAITTGTFDLTIGALAQTVPVVDLSGAADFAGVAAALQTAIRAANANPLFASSTVTYDAARHRFVFAAGGTGANVIDVSDEATTQALGWSVPNGAVLSNGVAAETVTEMLVRSTIASNNFGSFAFVPAVTQAQVIEAATWNDGNNLLFQFHTSVLPADAATLSAAIIGLAGTGMTLQGPTITNEFPEVLPMAVLAATDYTRRAAVQNYMFQQAALTPTVTNATDADLYDGQRVNYYGRTQTAGQFLAFYQRGFLTGTGNDPINMNIFANEQWLKDFLGTRLLNLLLNSRVPANATGRGRVLAVLRDGASTALINGTFSVGRTLSAEQRVFITEQTGDPVAFHQVQTSGFWLDAAVVQDGAEFRINYTLIYAADEVIRRVDGVHTIA